MGRELWDLLCEGLLCGLFVVVVRRSYWRNMLKNIFLLHIKMQTHDTFHHYA